jgi:hypothetical protein
LPGNLRPGNLRSHSAHCTRKTLKAQQNIDAKQRRKDLHKPPAEEILRMTVMNFPYWFMVFNRIGKK